MRKRAIFATLGLIAGGCFVRGAEVVDSLGSSGSGGSAGDSSGLSGAPTGGSSDGAGFSNGGHATTGGSSAASSGSAGESSSSAGDSNSNAGESSAGGGSAGAAGSGASGSNVGGAAGTGSGGKAGGGAAGGGAAGSGAAGAAGSASVGACASNPCTHGACAVSGNGFKCTCDNGYSGSTCETNIDDCSPNPCANGTACVDGVASFTCNCATSGYAGTLCDLPRFEAIFPGYTSAGPGAISPDGTIVTGGGMVALKWTHAGGVQMLSVCTGQPCGLGAMTPDGSIIIGSQTSFSSGLTLEVFRVVNGAATVLPPAPWTGCIGAGMNSTGSIVVSSCLDDQDVGHASRWQLSGSNFVLDSLPVPALSIRDSALAVSADGTSIAGYYEVAGNHARALHWTAKPNTTPTYDDIGTFNNATFTQAAAISADGSTVVGSADSSSSAPLAFRWTKAGGLQGLAFDAADGVNADGSVIVGVRGTDAVVYSAASGVRVIRDVLLAAGVSSATLAGWTLGTAIAVSADGKTIVGDGTGPSAQGDAWLARLP